MTDMNDPAGRRRPARAFVEKSLQAEREGDEDEAERLMEEAERIDPDETTAVLQEEVVVPDSERLEAGAAPPGREAAGGRRAG